MNYKKLSTTFSVSIATFFGSMGVWNYDVAAANSKIPCSYNNTIDTKCVQEKARESTVKVSPKNFGAIYTASGSMIGKNGNIYFAMTNEHVKEGIDDTNLSKKSKGIQIETFDGKIHDASIETKIKLDGLDLVLLSFKSTNSYKVPVLGEAKGIKDNDSVFVSGYPCKNLNNCDEGYEFTFTSGSAYTGALNGKILNKGFNLGYSNVTIDGMSGGTVFDRNGQLIGIHGRGRYVPRPLAAMIPGEPSPLTFMDGQKVNPLLEEKIKSHSWAIPIDSIKPKIEKIIDTPAKDRVPSDLVNLNQISNGSKSRIDPFLSLFAKGRIQQWWEESIYPDKDRSKSVLKVIIKPIENQVKLVIAALPKPLDPTLVKAVGTNTETTRPKDRNNPQKESGLDNPISTFPPENVLIGFLLSGAGLILIGGFVYSKPKKELKTPEISESSVEESSSKVSPQECDAANGKQFTYQINFDRDQQTLYVKVEKEGKLIYRTMYQINCHVDGLEFINTNNLHIKIIKPKNVNIIDDMRLALNEVKTKQVMGLKTHKYSLSADTEMSTGHSVDRINITCNKTGIIFLFFEQLDSNYSSQKDKYIQKR